MRGREGRKEDTLIVVDGRVGTLAFVLLRRSRGCDKEMGRLWTRFVAVGNGLADLHANRLFQTLRMAASSRTMGIRSVNISSFMSF
jgi:hypothetical protein